MGKEGRIFNIERFAYQDGPGIRTIIFLKGCPLHCQWCANPEGQLYSFNLQYFQEKCIGCGRCVDVCPQGAIEVDPQGKSVTDRSACIGCGKGAEICLNDARKIIGRDVTVKEVIDTIKKDELFYHNTSGGITLSGGEPLNQPEFAYSLLKRSQELHIHTAIETSAYVDWETLERILEVLDLIMVDIKHMDPMVHERYTGVSNDKILNNIAQLASLPSPSKIVRIPIVPGINDTKGNIKATAQFLSNIGIINVELLPYHELGLSKYQTLDWPYTIDTEPPRKEELEDLKKRMTSFGLEVKIEGFVSK
ncbi:MAG: glycyl-radical enzyme activating protein [Candidatus Korarchaeota archaeon]|nr:glycyl-radical enzyme activating protein [Candidatus Korarchaeota archaeon]NIU82044.1 glycyl-radical enzyme activating protein [Candidatus Thorarchaeota archaeon]NIW12463.1 glycyl-radical enzyme activating protein [Candidatus Thorarchaeota archaeon]NIW50678.1 glycyl-radical enzyme activating protein [Candidatus Korarchaeota archaeon]